MARTRWEYGSQYHWMRISPDGIQGKVPWRGENLLFGCGRDALRALVHHLHPDRLWFPSYICQELVAPFIDSGVEVRWYPDSPLATSLNLERIGLRTDDAVVVVNYFGLRSRDCLIPTAAENAILIEDHTHDPCSTWAEQSRADYCFASLRKSIPIPDGAVLWSPRSREMPRMSSTKSDRAKAVQQRLFGMLMKSLYLEGHDISKPLFRELIDSGERNAATGSVAKISLLSETVIEVFPFDAWRRARRDNFQQLAAGLGSARHFEVLKPTEREAAPFAVACLFPDAESCAAAEKLIIGKDIYPSRLWPLEDSVVAEVPEEHVCLSRRMLTLPTDGRYTQRDVDRLLDVFAESGLV